ncbi:MAG: rhomboid family intramembrane serine protease, partial [Ilumatobacter sp.]
RPVGRHCTRCGKPACAECLHQVSVGSHCTECVKAARPDIRTRAKYWQAGKPAIVTTTLIALNVVVFVILGLVYGLSDMIGQSGGEAHARFGLFGPALGGDPIGLFRTADGDLVTSNGNEWYRLVTSGFLHYGIIHIGFNMYILFMLGNMLEPQLGRVKFLSIYFASMLGGSAGALLIEPNALTAGASGAVFGLLGAAAVGMWHQGINPFSTGVGRLLLINLAFTFLWPNISIGGHLGGVVAGALCAFVMMAPAYKGFPRWAASITPLAVAVVAVVASVVAVR